MLHPLNGRLRHSTVLSNRTTRAPSVTILTKAGTEREIHYFYPSDSQFVSAADLRACRAGEAVKLSWTLTNCTHSLRSSG